MYKFFKIQNDESQTSAAVSAIAAPLCSAITTALARSGTSPFLLNQLIDLASLLVRHMNPEAFLSVMGSVSSLSKSCPSVQTTVARFIGRCAVCVPSEGKTLVIVFYLFTFNNSLFAQSFAQAPLLEKVKEINVALLSSSDWTVRTEILRNLRVFATICQKHVKPLIPDHAIPSLVLFVQDEPTPLKVLSVACIQKRG